MAALDHDFSTVLLEQPRPGQLARPTFRLRGDHREFRCVPLGAVPAGVIFNLVAAPEKEHDEAAATAAVLQFLANIVDKRDWQRFHELIHRPYDEVQLTDDTPVPDGWAVETRPTDDGRVERWAFWWPLTYDELHACATGLVRTYTGVPTRPSNGSPPGASSTGRSSRDGVSPEASDQTSGPHPAPPTPTEPAMMGEPQRTPGPGGSPHRASSTGQPDSSSASPTPGT